MILICYINLLEVKITLSKLFRMKFRAKNRRPPPLHLINKPRPFHFLWKSVHPDIIQSLLTAKQGRVFKFPEYAVWLTSEKLQTARFK